MRSWGRVVALASSALVGSAFPALASGAGIAAILRASPLPRSVSAAGAGVEAAIVPVVLFGQDGRRAPGLFAAEHRLDAAEVEHSHAASGLIQCGNAHGAGQLTLTDDVVTTAAHVFYDENGIARARTCSFDLTIDGREVHVPIDLSDIVAGSTKPYDVDPARDWAVARLVRPVAGVRPYGLVTDVHANQAITFVARGHIDWGDAKRLSMQECTLRDGIPAAEEEGTREFSFDCDTGDGASGGALMFDRDMMRIGAILVGWRSNRPFKAMPFSPTHYNFAVTIEGAFRQAVYAAARKMVVQK